MLNIVLFGPPGAGKGTQAAMLTGKYGLNHISTGQVIRDEIAQGTSLGLGMADYIARGEFAPDDLVIEIVADYVEQHRGSAGNIFDGFPRTLVQAEHFDIIMRDHEAPVTVMLSLKVPEEAVIQRLLLRGQESGRADDFSEEVIHNRIRIYNERTAVVEDYYARQGKYVPIDGTGTIQETFHKLCEVIDMYLCEKK